MPQLIAMIIVVVGAMVYMFQTFGGTGDKIEGIAQKTSVITELNNIKNGIQLALRSGDITTDDMTYNDSDGNSVTINGTTLQALAALEYFADQINNELENNTDTGLRTNGGVNTYSAISFGGEDNPGMLIDLILNDTAPTGNNITQRPGLRVEFTGSLSANAGFLENQITSDLSATASIDRTSKENEAVVLDENGDVPAANRSSTQNGTASGEDLVDGIFTVYFKDIPASVVQ